MTYVHSFVWHLLSDQTTVVSIVAVGAAIIYLLRPFYDVTAAVCAKDFDFLAMHSVQDAEKDSSWRCEKVRRTDIQTVAAPTSRRWMHGPNANATELECGTLPSHFLAARTRHVNTDA